MSRFADLVIKEDRTPEEDQELHVLAQQLDYVVADVGTAIGPSGVISHLRAGSVVLDNAGMHTFLGGVETGRIEADGDFLLGSNIAAAATTSFAVFTNAQTYNSESIGEGDLLVGDNTASKANILWDKSAGQLLFRGGTTTQGYIDTDGAATFGGGDVVLNSSGIILKTDSSDPSTLTWRDSFTGQAYLTIYTLLSGTTPNLYAQNYISSLHETGGTIGSTINLQPSRTDAYSTVLTLNGNGKRIGFSTQSDDGSSTYRFDLYQAEAVFNDTGTDQDFRVETDGNTHTIFAEGSTNRVGILNSSPSEALDVTGNVAVSGTVGIGTAATALRGISLIKTFTDGTALNAAQYNQFTINSNSNSTASQRALSFVALAQGSGGSTGGLIGLQAEAQNQQTAGTWSSAVAISLVTRNTNASALTTATGVQHAFVVSGTGNIFNASDFIARSPVLSSTGIITNHYGFYVQNLGNAKQTNSWGVYVAAQSGSTTKNYAIYTNAGDIALNAGADGATTVVIGGATPQTNGGFLQIESGWTFKETAAPTADTNYGKMWTNTSDELWFQDGAGANHLLHGDAFSEIWFHGATPAVVTISTEDAFTLVNSFAVVGHEDDSSNVVGNISTDTLTLSAKGGGEYEISYHASITTTGASKEVMACVGVVLATAKDITDVTDDTVSPIVITSTAHGLNNGDMVEIVGVLGNTAANGSFIVANKAADTFQIVALDGTATTGNGDFDEGSPTGDVTIWYLGNMVTRRAVSQTDLGSISATGLHVLQNGDVLSLYIANLDDTSNINIYAVSLDANRIGD